MFGSGAQSIKLNPKLFLVDIRNFTNFAQLSFTIGKGFKILVIFLSKGKLWTVGLADLDWLAVWHGFIQLGSVLEAKQKPYRFGLLDSFSMEN